MFFIWERIDPRFSNKNPNYYTTNFKHLDEVWYAMHWAADNNPLFPDYKANSVDCSDEHLRLLKRIWKVWSEMGRPLASYQIERFKVSPDPVSIPVLEE